MLRIMSARVAAQQQQRLVASRLLHSSVARSNVTNVPPTSVPGTPNPTAPMENPTPATPSTPNLSSSASSGTPPPPPLPPPKTTNRFRKFLLSVTVLGAIVYGGGVWFALWNDNFHDFYTEYVPFGEQLVMIIEEREFQRRFPNAGRKPLEDDAKRVTVQRGGATWKMVGDEYKGPSTGPHVSAVAKDKNVPKTETKKDVPPPPAPVPAPPVPEPKKQEPLVIRETVLPKLPKFVFDGTTDPSLENVVKSINGLFTALTTSGAAGPEELSALAASLGEVSNKFVALVAKYETELKENLDQQALVFALQNEKREQDYKQQLATVDEKWREGYFEERRRIMDTYKKRLIAELKKFNQVYSGRLRNEVAAANAEKDKLFADKVVETVENERNSRLSKLKDLKLAFEEVMALSADVDKQLETAERTAELQLALGSLTNALQAPYSVPLAPIVARIKEVGGDDPLISAAVAAVPVAAYDGVLTPAQLAARFKLLVPEIRKVSLVPADAGVAGFVGSWLFSKLLWKKEGKPKGTDVESVLARAESALVEGQVDEAVREVNSLDGWRKKLAEDWLAEGRKRTEVEFLARVLGEEGKVWQYKY
ncbi:mitochondrial inner membrane protein-domain-containing protein [Lipomyces tetrasporus]|uniref:MICOS complex subunit MIC60 n=1 Tax=Lipomyces tetrasporus TaxID=54092 RepID=A0AAD7QR57_9ASCO|nr:mitochondrial inner membrane protein-domain-containing protein [Lipomyces tetrasporus]KAJ8099944.1 mitochondrial inner membrane protein-domain-containing protein [Lipomyces tetrasporus]